uniref:Uncharacterized protein n=1 Tax=Cucumis melo TaxID=3656 RepID=A0A9I9EHM7_CUCME
MTELLCRSCHTSPLMTPPFCAVRHTTRRRTIYWLKEQNRSFPSTAPVTATIGGSLPLSSTMHRITDSRLRSLKELTIKGDKQNWNEMV